MIAKTPNIIVYLSHDTGRHISPYGVTTVHTPAADRFAREGVVLENTFCTAPQCSPSRASLFTGRYPHSNGVMGLTHRDFAWDLNADEMHAANYFRALGYETASIGHLHEIRHPEQIGWDFFSEEQFSSRIPAVTQAWFDQRRDQSKPFYLQISTFETHLPLETDGVQPDEEKGVTVPPYLQSGEATKRHFAALQGSVRRWDEGLGGLLDFLDRHGLTEDTLLVVTSDHGIAAPRAKLTLYDPGIEVITMIRWPGGGIAPGTRFSPLISNVDILPTMLEAAGALPPATCQGRSFLPLLRGEAYEPRQEIFAEKTFHNYYDPIRCVRTEDWKYIRNFENSPGVNLGEDSCYIRDELFENFDLFQEPQRHPAEELYDLRTDPNERKNLAGDPKAEPVRKEMATRLARWMRETSDPLLNGPIASPFFRRSIADLERMK